MTNFVVLALGNSTAAAAPVAGDRLGEVSRVPVHELQELSDVLAACRANGAGPAPTKTAHPAPAAAAKCVPLVVASVNPPALEELRRLADDMHLAPPLVARDDFSIPLKVAVDEPDRVGTDRLLGALAAWRQAGGACLVLDCGTATTLSAVSADGTFLGGAIFPGPDLMARSLAEGTAQLPAVDVREIAPGIGREFLKIVPVIGKNTEAAIRAGISLGWTGAVLNILAAALADVGQQANIFLTGGGLALTRPLVDDLLGNMGAMADAEPPHDPCRIAPNLVLEGLVIAYRESVGR
jgi:pantothenate kinase type III